MSIQCTILSPSEDKMKTESQTTQGKYLLKIISNTNLTVRDLCLMSKWFSNNKKGFKFYHSLV